MNLVSDKVFCKRENSNQWKGPGFVIGQDGEIISVHHGSIYVNVSANRIMKLNDEVKISPEENGSEKKDQQSGNPVTSTISLEEDQEDKPNFNDEAGEEDNQENMMDSVATASSETYDTSDFSKNWYI